MANNRFKTLKDQITQGDVLLPGDPGYEESLSRWSATCVKPAAVVVKPTSTSEVSAAVRFAATRNIPFNVMCGGHSTSGSSASDGGMVIHMERMRKTKVDTINQTITFDGGCLWKDVNEATSKHGLATVGGIIGHTGVGGLILGGGYGHLTGRHGLCIDCLLSVEVVLADGSVVQASENENTDLFWAIRGAGAAFGVVTQFRSKVFPQGDVWGGALVFPIEKLPELVNFTNSFLANTKGDDGILLVLGYSPATGTRKVATLSVFYNGSPAAAKAIYKPLFDLKPLVDTTGIKTYPQFNTLLDKAHKHGRRYLHGGSNFVLPLSTQAMQEVSDKWFGFLEDSEHKDMDFSRLGFELQPRTKICAVPFEKTSCANRGEEYNVSILLAWEQANHDDAVRQFCRGLSSFIRSSIGQSADVVKGAVGIYNNYRFEETTAEESFGAHASRLIALKKKYDPDNRFDKQWRLRTARSASL